MATLLMTQADVNRNDSLLKLKVRRVESISINSQPLHSSRLTFSLVRKDNHIPKFKKRKRFISNNKPPSFYLIVYRLYKYS